VKTGREAAVDPAMSTVKTVLIVDDSASFRRQVKQTLEAANFDVVEAEDGERGLAVARERPIHAMLVDVNMPIMGGLEMISKVRAMPQHHTTPIFVVTTESGTMEAKQGKSAGATAWIVKPIKADALIQALHRVAGA